MNELDELLTSISDFLAFLSPLGADFDFNTLNSIQGMFNSYLTALYAYISNGSFPNVNYLTLDHQIYYLVLSEILTTSPTNGVFWKSLPHKPTIFYQDGKLTFRQSFQGKTDLKGAQINDIVIGSKLSALLPTSWSPPCYKRINGLANLGIVPYYNATRYQTGKFSYYANDKFNLVYPNEFYGMVRLYLREMQALETGRVWQVPLIPIRRDDEVYNMTALPVASGDVRAKSDNSGLEVFRSGLWQPLWTF